MTTTLFSIRRDILKKALAVVTPTIKGGAGMEILGCVYIQVDDAQKVVSLTTTRIETTTQHILVGEDIIIERSCALALPATKLADLVDKMTGDYIRFSPSVETDWWDLSFDVPGSKKPGVAQLGGLDPDHFPAQQIVNLRPLVSFDAEQFGGYLKQVYTMVSKSGGYAALESMCMKLPLVGEFITMYGADNTHGIARIYMPILECFEDYREAELIIPQKSLITLMNAKPTTPEITMLASPNGSLLGFRFGPTTIMTTLMTDKYPKVEQIFREGSTFRVTVNRAALDRVVSMAQTLYGNEVKAIILSLEDDNLLQIKSYKTVNGALEQEVIASECTPGGFIQVNPTYLGDSLGALNTKEVTLEIESQAHGLVVKSAEKPNCLHMIFPMHGNVPGKGVNK